MEWVEAQVFKETDYYVKWRRHKKGPLMTVDYEDIWIRPKGVLSEELMRQSLEEELETRSSVSYLEPTQVEDENDEGN